MTAATLISHHNLAFYLSLMQRTRAAIAGGEFHSFKKAELEKLSENESAGV